MKVIFALLGIVGILFLLFWLIPFIFMLCWNAILPMFWAAAPTLTFWKSWGLLFIVGTLGRYIKGDVHIINPSKS